MYFKIETISALPTESYGYALTGRVEYLSANHPPVAPLRLQAYRDTARSLGYPLAVVSLVQSDGCVNNLYLSMTKFPKHTIVDEDRQMQFTNHAWGLTDVQSVG